MTPTDVRKTERIKRKRQWRRLMQTSRDLPDGSVLWKGSFHFVNGGGIRFDRSGVWGASSVVGLMSVLWRETVIQVCFFCAVVSL